LEESLSKEVIQTLSVLFEDSVIQSVLHGALNFLTLSMDPNLVSEGLCGSSRHPHFRKIQLGTSCLDHPADKP
jgi:hypothetical protein